MIVMEGGRRTNERERERNRYRAYKYEEGQRKFM